MGECLIIRGGGGTDTSNATATAAKVLSGYTCYVNDSKITGTMANCGTRNASLNAGGSFTIPAGHHNGSGKISVNSLSSQTSATANAGRILSGRTAWVGGSKLTGTMTNRGAVSQALGANGSYTIPAGWHNGSGKVTQSLTKQAAVNITPGTANKTACAANRWTTGNVVIVGSSTLTAGNIKKGVSIFGVTGTFASWVDSSYNFSQGGYTPGSWCITNVTTHQRCACDLYRYVNIGGMIASGFNWINVKCHLLYIPNDRYSEPTSTIFAALTMTWDDGKGGIYNSSWYGLIWFNDQWDAEYPYLQDYRLDTTVERALPLKHPTGGWWATTMTIHGECYAPKYYTGNIWIDGIWLTK